MVFFFLFFFYVLLGNTFKCSEYNQLPVSSKTWIKAYEMLSQIPAMRHLEAEMLALKLKAANQFSVLSVAELRC